MLKGKVAPGARVAGAPGRRRARRPRPDRPLEAPFVGRDDELRLLKDCSTPRRARAAAPGVDHRACPASARAGWRGSSSSTSTAWSSTVYWHVGRSPAYGEGITFWALGEMVRGRAAWSRPTTRRRPEPRSPRRSRAGSPTRPSAAGSSPRCSPCSGSRAAPARLARSCSRLAHVLRADRRERTRRPRVRGPALGRCGPARLHRPRARLERGRPDLTIVTLARPELLERRPGWGSGTRTSSRSPSSRSPTTRCGELLAALVPGPSGRRPCDHRRPSRRHPAVRRRDRPDARRGRRLESATAYDRRRPRTSPSRRRSRRSSRPASTRSTRPIARSSAMRRCSGRASPWPASARSAASTPKSLEPPPRARPARAARPRRRSAFARARPVRVRPGADPRGRLQHAGASATGGAATWRRRATSRGWATTSWPAPSPATTWRRIAPRATTPRARPSRRRRGSRSAGRPSGRRARRHEQASVFFLEALEVSSDPAERADLLERAGLAADAAGHSGG